MKPGLQIKEKSIVTIYIQRNLLGFEKTLCTKKKDDGYFNASFLEREKMASVGCYTNYYYGALFFGEKKRMAIAFFFFL